MTQETIKNFLNEISNKGPKQNYVTNKTNVYHIDDIWSLDILELKFYSPESSKVWRYVLVVMDNFSKYGWTVTLKKKYFKQ